MLLDDLIGEPFGARPWPPSPETDPLREDDALQEAQILDVRLEVVTSTAAVLIELRGAIELRIPRTGLLVAHGVEKLSWDAQPRGTPFTAWNIMASQVLDEQDRLRARFDLYPDAEFAFTAIDMAFYAVDVLGMSGTPPDYTEPDASRRHPDLAQWTSPVEVLSASFRSADRARPLT